ncbi:MAG: hypothetical protein AB2L24_10510 [Mangrovibacterium sp.]
MNKDKTPEKNFEDINKFYEQMEKEKEDRLIDLIVEIIVDATLREYYGRIDARDNLTSNKENDE